MNSCARAGGTLFAMLSLACVAVATAAAQKPEAPPPNMAAYYVGLLKTGSERSTGDKAADADLQSRHLASMERRWREKTVVGAGPIMEGGDLRGILIITADTVERARLIASDDPAVQAGRLRVEVHPWWGPKDIGAAYTARAQADPAAQPTMRTYQLAFLRRGPKWTAEESPALAAMQEQHMAHIRKMGESGKLVAAGPFLDDGDLAGIFVFDATAEEARALAAQDPTVKAGRLVLEFYGWMAAEGVLPVRH
jgi:uncharacterized protein YciI